MKKIKISIATALVAVLTVSLAQSSGFAKENSKPVSKPMAQPNSNSSKSDTSANSVNQSSSTPKSPNSSSANSDSPNSNTAASTSAASNPPASHSQADKTPGPSSPVITEKKSSPSATSITAQGSDSPSVAKKSSNPKLDPSLIASNKANSRADSAAKAKSVSLASCTPAAQAKAKSSADLCSDFIVVFKEGFGRTNSNKIVKDSGAQVLREYSNIFNGALVNGPLAKMQALANNPNVLVVEDDLQVTTTAVQTNAPWGLDRIDQASGLSTTFDDGLSNGLNTYSYVVDTGIDASNVDFEGRVAAGFTAIADGRGSADCNGHGTHVAGTIGGKTYGVAKKTNLIPVRVLDCAGSGSYSSVISGLDWIAANYTAGQAAVVNMSLGGPISSTLDGAVRNLIAKGISVVVAAGNSAADACNYSPSSVVDAVTVGSTTTTDYRSSFSNFGTCLDIFAPGSSITSTWLGSSGTNTISGTSMAAPHVAGVIARFVGTNATLTPQQISTSIKSSALGTVLSAGTGSINKLVFLNITPDLTAPAPVDSTPKFRKVSPRGKR